MENLNKNSTHNMNGGFLLQLAYYTIKFIMILTKVY